MDNLETNLDEFKKDDVLFGNENKNMDVLIDLGYQLYQIDKMLKNIGFYHNDIKPQNMMIKRVPK